MMIFMQILGFLCPVLWLILLIHWWRQKNFYSLFSTHRRNKIFWGLTFVFFSPLLNILYFFFASKHRLSLLPTMDLKKRRYVTLILIGLTILLLEVPLPPFDQVSIMTKETDRTSPAPLSLKMTASAFNSSMSASSMKSSGSTARLDIRHIAIMNSSAHPIMIKTARRLQKTLLNLPMVEQVAYYPAGHEPEEGKLLPELFIQLEMPERRIIFLPGGRLSTLTGSCIISERRENIAPDFPGSQDLPRVKLSNDICIDLKGRVMGFESPAARYDDEAAQMTQAFLNNLLPYLISIATESGLMPKLPNYLYGSFKPAPPMPFEQRDSILRKTSGYGLMSHNITTWLYEEPLPTETALSNLLHRLEIDGWKKHSNYDQWLSMKRGTEHVCFARKKVIRNAQFHFSNDAKAKQQVQQPMVAYYRHMFSKEERIQIIQHIMDDPFYAENYFLMFGHMIKRSGSKQLNKRYEQLIAAYTPNTADECLEISDHWKRKGNTDRAIELLKKAQSFAWITPQADDLRRNIKRRAKKLGFEDEFKQAPTEAELQSVGILPVEAIGSNLVKQVLLGQPAGFYAYVENSYPDERELQTLIFTMIPDSENPGEIKLQSMRKRAHSSSWSSTGRQSRNNGWEHADHLSKVWIETEAHELENGSFEFQFSNRAF